MPYNFVKIAWQEIIQEIPKIMSDLKPLICQKGGGWQFYIKPFLKTFVYEKLMEKVLLQLFKTCYFFL